MSPGPSSLSNSDAIMFQMDDVAQQTPPVSARTPEPIIEQPEGEKCPMGHPTHGTSCKYPHD